VFDLFHLEKNVEYSSPSISSSSSSEIDQCAALDTKNFKRSRFDSIPYQKSSEKQFYLDQIKNIYKSLIIDDNNSFLFNKDTDGNTVLHIIVQNNYLFNYNYAYDENDYSSIFQNTKRKIIRMSKKIIEKIFKLMKGKIEINARNNHEYTPILLACAARNYYAIAFLLDLGGNHQIKYKKDLFVFGDRLQKNESSARIPLNSKCAGNLSVSSDKIDNQEICANGKIILNASDTIHEELTLLDISKFIRDEHLIELFSVLKL
jgi:ankyrin repeat protein